MSKIIVQIEGGLVQQASILKNDLFPGDNVDGVIVVDFDTDGADGDELTETTDKDGAYLDAVIHEEEIWKLKSDCDVERVTMAYLEPKIVTNTKDKDLPLLIPKLTSDAGKKALDERLKGIA